MFSKSVVVILFFIMSTSALLAAPAITVPAVPNNLHVYDAAGNTYVDHVAHGCSGIRYFIDPNHVKYDAIISILMAAQISGKKVILRYNGCNTIPQGKVIGVYLQGN